MPKHLLILLLLHGSLAVYAQHADTTKAAQPDSALQGMHPTERKLTFGRYFTLLKSDFIQQGASPFHTKGNDWAKEGIFAAAIAALLASDESIEHHALQLRHGSGFIQQVSPVVTKFGGRQELYTLGAIGAYSLVTKNEKLKTTTLLATQAYVTAGLWTNIIKFITGRQRPSYYDLRTGENEASWHGMLYQFRKEVSGKKPDGAMFSAFPSGHATVAFAVATVFAEQYRNQPVIRIIAYTSASLVALSRITENKHWASDVLVGSAIGFLCGRQVVKNFSRPQKNSALHPQKKNALSFTLHYINRMITPKMVYTFR